MRDEIDLIGLVVQLWRKKWLVAAVTAAFVVVGVTVALLSPTKYTARCVMVAQTGSASTANSRMTGLAAMAGINLNTTQSVDILSPVLYPRILASVPVQKELMQTPLNIVGHAGPVRFIDYYYSESPADGAAAVPQYDGIETLTARERACRKTLYESIGISLDTKTSEITLSATMPDALAAAQLARAAETTLQRHIIDMRVQKVRETLDFVEKRCEEARHEFEAAQSALAAYRDSNRNMVSQSAMMRGEQLQNDLDLALSIYSDLASQREQARIRLKEDTPVFTIIEPVTIPGSPSAPNRVKIIAIFFILGLVAGCATVFGLSAIAKLRAQ